ncbi:MAG: hypothetical protein ACYDCL_01535 [Myxococcales bacterium]
MDGRAEQLESDSGPRRIPRHERVASGRREQANPPDARGERHPADRTQTPGVAAVPEGREAVAGAKRELPPERTPPGRLPGLVQRENLSSLADRHDHAVSLAVDVPSEEELGRRERSVERCGAVGAVLLHEVAAELDDPALERPEVPAKLEQDPKALHVVEAL